MTEFDDTLTRLFAETRESLPDEEFLQRCASGVRRARRRRSLRRAAVATAAAGIAVAVTPYVVTGSLAVAAGPTSPVVWICSLAVAAWAQRRSRRMS